MSKGQHQLGRSLAPVSPTASLSPERVSTAGDEGAEDGEEDTTGTPLVAAPIGDALRSPATGQGFLLDGEGGDESQDPDDSRWDAGELDGATSADEDLAYLIQGSSPTMDDLPSRWGRADSPDVDSNEMVEDAYDGAEGNEEELAINSQEKLVAFVDNEADDDGADMVEYNETDLATATVLLAAQQQSHRQQVQQTQQQTEARYAQPHDHQRSAPVQASVGAGGRAGGSSGAGGLGGSQAAASIIRRRADETGGTKGKGWRAKAAALPQEVIVCAHLLPQIKSAVSPLVADLVLCYSQEYPVLPARSG